MADFSAASRFRLGFFRSKARAPGSHKLKWPVKREDRVGKICLGQNTKHKDWRVLASTYDLQTLCNLVFVTFEYFRNEFVLA